MRTQTAVQACIQQATGNEQAGVPTTSQINIATEGGGHSSGCATCDCGDELVAEDTAIFVSCSIPTLAHALH